MKDLQQYLDKKYPELRLDARKCRFNSVIDVYGMVGYGFEIVITDKITQHTDNKLLAALIETKDLVEFSIEKVKINLGKPEKILGVDVIRVDGEYWASIGAVYLLIDKVVEVKPPRLEEQAGALFYGKIPIVYKPALDK